MIRAPLLPVERYRALQGWVGDHTTVVDQQVRNSIYAASPSLGRAIDAGTGPASSAVVAPLLRYLIRMSTRPTPYGLFAGVGLGRWGASTTLRLGPGPRPTRTRPDMGWLIDWLLALESDPDVLRHSTLQANTSAFEFRGRVHLADPGPGGHTTLPDLSIRATAAVSRALTLAREPIHWPALSAALLATSTGATVERVDGLIEELCRLTLLLPGLRPPLTNDPVVFATRRLAELPPTRAAAARLRTAVTRIQKLDHPEAQQAGTYPTALAAADRLLRDLHAGAATDAPLLQIDSALPLAARDVTRQVAEDATQAADLLLRLHPAPGGPPHLAAFRARFLAHYGHDRRVPLLELLDPRFGLGPTSERSGYGLHHGHPYRSRRDPLLLELAATALRDGQDEVRLGKAELEALTTWTPATDRVPASVELSLFLLAVSSAAVDRGDYRLMIGPNLGAQAGGRGLGRFSDLLGPEARTLLQEIAHAEDELRPVGVTAELTYLPTHPRSANVIVRPAVREYEIPVGVQPGVPPQRVIAVDRLSVLVRDDSLRLWWEDGQCEVTVAAGHMLNTAGASAVIRFLHEIGQDGVTGLTEFDWGPAAQLPFLPRVVVGRVILRPAQWRLQKERVQRDWRIDDASAFRTALDAWRDRWRVPRHVYIAAGDNRLLVDLDDREQADLLRGELRRPYGDVVLHEGLPGPGEAWLRGPGGHYVTELVVPMVTRAGPPAAGTGTPAAATVAELVSETERRRPPGSDWLYLKLYGSAAEEDRLLTGTLRNVVGKLVSDGEASSWFFIRYADPEPHLRLRVQGDPQALLSRVLPQLMFVATQLISVGLRRAVTIEPYEREVERYGGPAQMALAEAIFAADSSAVAALLGRLTPGDEEARVQLAVVSINALLTALGMDPAARVAWCAVGAPPPQDSGAAWRKSKTMLRSRLQSSDGAEGGSLSTVSSVLQRLKSEVEPVGRRISALEREGTGVGVPVLARSLVHLHANRLGLNRQQEELAVALLRRTLASLAAAPVAPG